MIKAHKIRLQPTPEQANYFARAAGTSRFVWNWALTEWNRHYEAPSDEMPIFVGPPFSRSSRSASGPMR